MKEDNIYDLIAAFLTGEIDSEQNERLQEWVILSKENKETFDRLRLAWGVSFADYSQMAISKENILNNVLATVRRRRFIKPVVVVASLACALTIGFICASLFQKSIPIENLVPLMPEGIVSITTLPGQKAKATLPDGTIVWLNSGTTLSYPSDFGINERTVTLVEGEIYLDVTKKEGQLLTLMTPDGIIKVYGTSFDVMDYPSDHSIKVSLDNGSIEFLTKDNDSKTLISPGQKLIMDKISGSLVLSKCNPELESIWRFGELKIERERFLDVMTDMERWYGVDIQVSGLIPEDSYFWMTIKTESLREMLGLLNRITPLSYEINGKDVLIKLK